jgi:ESF2/ABP1 family protein
MKGKTPAKQKRKHSDEEGSESGDQNRESENDMSEGRMGGNDGSGSEAEEGKDHGGDTENEEEQQDEESEAGEEFAKKVKGPLNLKSIAKFQQKQDRTGVLYISRVPPFMKPEKIRHLLSKHGEVGRIFLTPEDPAIRKRRKAMGGNKRKSYVDGWVEFMNKRDAKIVAKSLNATAIGGKSTSFFSADLWNLKYLSGFKWKHLTEKIAYDNAVRRQKLQAEIAQAKREKDFYMERVEQHKRLAKRPKKQPEESANAQENAGDGGKKPTVLRTFRQSQPISSSHHGKFIASFGRSLYHAHAHNSEQHIVGFSAAAFFSAWQRPWLPDALTDMLCSATQVPRRPPRNQAQQHSRKMDFYPRFLVANPCDSF